MFRPLISSSPPSLAMVSYSRYCPNDTLSISSLRHLVIVEIGVRVRKNDLLYIYRLNSVIIRITMVYSGDDCVIGDIL